MPIYVSKQMTPPPLQFVVGDGRIGHPPSAPYDIIHVGAALPEALLPQLLAQATLPQLHWNLRASTRPPHVSLVFRSNWAAV
jgi:hypothetical protein